MRTIVYRATDSIQAPNWTTDGKALIFNRNGRLYRFDLATREPTEIDTGFATENNNDHVLSFDGKMLGISHRRDAESNSIVYTVPVERRHAEGDHADRAVVSARLVAGRQGAGLHRRPRRQLRHLLDCRPTAAAGDAAHHHDGLDDGPEYSPDGQLHLFQLDAQRPDANLADAARRLRARAGDRRRVQQLVPAHLAGRQADRVPVVPRPDVTPDDHPFYKQVYLRLMPYPAGAPKVIAYVYGGQGTINVPSWSPDSKKIAFVSNTAGN